MQVTKRAKFPVRKSQLSTRKAPRRTPSRAFRTSPPHEGVPADHAHQAGDRGRCERGRRDAHEAETCVADVEDARTRRIQELQGTSGHRTVQSEDECHRCVSRISRRSSKRTGRPSKAKGNDGRRIHPKELRLTRWNVHHDTTCLAVGANGSGKTNFFQGESDKNETTSDVWSFETVADAWNSNDRATKPSDSC